MKQLRQQPGKVERTQIPQVGCSGKPILRWRLRCRSLLGSDLGINTWGREGKGREEDWAEREVKLMIQSQQKRQQTLQGVLKVDDPSELFLSWENKARPL